MSAMMLKSHLTSHDDDVVGVSEISKLDLAGSVAVDVCRLRLTDLVEEQAIQEQ